MHYEVEQKFSVTDPGRLQRRLEALGAVLQPPQQQVDRYYNHPARDFARTDEALRIRSVGQDNFVTYKGPKLDAQTKTRREIELPLPHGESGAEAFATLLESLGFVPVAAVRKQRRRAEVAWHNRIVEAVLDEVDGLGTFVELELSVGQSEVQQAKDCVASLAGELQLAGSERRSYLELLLEKGRVG